LKAIKFKVGDKVVYPGHGVGEIIEIKAKSIADTEQQFFRYCDYRYRYEDFGTCAAGRNGGIATSR